ncbi:MAG TPA: hypothetical protein VME17_18835 [Bryobacteraceae bacterium]|nr:hypothetical protein [Bryobacteraceae bacterium]
MGWSRFVFVFLVVLAPSAFAQTAEGSLAPGTLPAPSVSEKWQHFETETFAPLTLGAGAFNAAVSQLTDSTPLYGREFFPAYPERFGSAVGDIISQNFFGDFVLASAFHEDTRYFRRGPAHRLFPRIFYAISRSVITRTDTGDTTFNWADVGGTAMSAALSNAYYPPASRNVHAASVNWVTSLAGSGFANLLPEFLPDFRAWVKRHL